MKRITCMTCCLLLLLTGCQSGTRKADDVMLGLEWYSSIDNVKKAMSGYTFDEEYEEASLSGIRQTMLEYEDVPLYGHTCEELSLCFTSLGLVGINYHDDDGTFTEWRTWLTEKAGEPTSEDSVSAAWDPSPMEGVDSIYVLDRGEDIQISFFADDSGSETADSAEESTTEDTTYSHEEMPAVNGLTFYADIADAKVAMGRAELEEYEEIGGSGYQLTLLDYEDVLFCGQECDLSLCFTSLGLVGINYTDDDSSLDAWITRLTEEYGEPDDRTDGDAVWENDPLGPGTCIYIIAFGDDMQISFFADDTGSEMAE